MGEKGAQWLVTLALLGCSSATSVPLFSHPERYLVGPFLDHFWAREKRLFLAEKWRAVPYTANLERNRLKNGLRIA